MNMLVRLVLMTSDTVNIDIILIWLVWNIFWIDKCSMKVLCTYK